MTARHPWPFPVRTREARELAAEASLLANEGAMQDPAKVPDPAQPVPEPDPYDPAREGEVGEVGEVNGEQGLKPPPA